MLKSLAQGMLLAATASLLAVLIAELALAVMGVSYPSFYVADPHRGRSLRPGAAGWQREEGEAFLTINSRGQRGEERSLEKPEGVFRIAVLGDSYTLAGQVDAENTFVAVMERELARCATVAERPIEALNFGVSGYGTTEQLLTLRHHALAYSPDLVLLAFFSGNDVTDNSRALAKLEMSPYYDLVDDRLVLDDSFRELPAYRFRLSALGRLVYRLIDHSRVLQIVNKARLGLRNRARKEAQNKLGLTGAAAAEPGIDIAIYRPPASAVWIDAWAVTERLIATMHELSIDAGSDFLLVSLSTGVQVHPDAALREEFQESLEIEDLFYPDRRIAEFAETAGIPVLILAPALRDYATENQRFLHGFDNARIGFGHWNEEGHRLGGELIARRICDSLQETVDS